MQRKLMLLSVVVGLLAAMPAEAVKVYQTKSEGTLGRAEAPALPVTNWLVPDRIDFLGKASQYRPR